jgi:hypothetical protein
LNEDKSQNNQERRSGKERRKFEYALHIPERRRGKDRRREDKRQKAEVLDKSSTLEKGNQEKTKNSKD